ncbi:Protein CBG10684 [Caenorhabditis briggsae]|uniref:Protein CBG10684 n=1 Tax=Caenorhabditis briggsae TaxID=6238 RepID=A8XBK3_CAEBR|nr:Protein CBG10684 [Caenorhabditis briggsae]CAP30019.2 Protein CBG10684 [Caenorhabditis briggsae]
MHPTAERPATTQRCTDIIGSILPLMEKTAKERKAALKRTLGSTAGSSWPLQKNMKME